MPKSFRFLQNGSYLKATNQYKEQTKRSRNNIPAYIMQGASDFHQEPKKAHSAIKRAIKISLIDNKHLCVSVPLCSIIPNPFWFES